MIKVVRGMRDLHGADMDLWHRAEEVFHTLPERFGYSEFRTPILEHTELFQRGVGEDTDIVGKEMYTFEDRSGDSLTLRPEMTAPIVRAAIEHNLVRHNPTSRLWYYGPLFRHERPQKGRYRQFYQFGAELLGSPHPEADAEIILLAVETLNALGINDVKLEINSLGIGDARQKYRDALVEYMEQHKDGLSEDSQRRLATNPLRILDSKNEGDKRIVANAPVLSDYLDEESKEHFATVCALLDSAGVTYVVNERMVRGLDYYSHTVFEFTTDKLGAQSAVCGGGRYDPLFAMLGGGDVPAVGFSFGVDRIILLLEQQENPEEVHVDAYVCAIGDAARMPAQLLALRLRRAGIRAVTDVQRRSMKGQMKDADKHKARWTLVLGDDELDSQTVVVKDMHQGAQDTVKLSEVEQHLKG